MSPQPTRVIDPLPPNAPYVLPFSTRGQLDDVGLNRFLQQLVLGVTGMEAEFVRPRWQHQPPTQPEIDQDWSAIGPVNREREKFPCVIHSTDPENFYRSKDTIYNNEIIACLASFYGPNKDHNAELFTMGLFLEQNREAIFLNGFGLVDVDDAVNVPALLKERWVPGTDIPFRLRRQMVFSYAVPNIKYVDATLYVEEGPVSPGYGEGPFNEYPYQGQSDIGIIEDASVDAAYPGPPYSQFPFGQPVNEGE